MRIINFLMVFFVSGMLLFTGTYLFEEYVLRPFYFIWDKGFDFVAWVVLYKTVKKEYEKLIIGLIIISGVRIVLDVIYNTGLIEVNNKTGVAVLFGLNIIYVIYASIKKNGRR